MTEQVATTPKKQRFFTKDLVKCVVVLAAIALVAGILLGVMNWITYVDPDETIMKDVAAFYGVDVSGISKSEDRAAMDEYVNSCFVAKNGEEEIGYCYYTTGNGAKDGTIEMLIYISSDGVIKDVVVYDQGETAGYFNKVEKANKAKYVGLDLDDIDGVTFYKKSPSGDLKDGEVVALSGATFTSTGYHNAVAAAVRAYKAYNKEA